MDGFVKYRNHVRRSHDPILDKGWTDDLPDYIRSGAARRRAACSHEWPSVVSGQSHPNVTGPGLGVRRDAGRDRSISSPPARRRRGSRRDGEARQGVQFPPLAPSGFAPGSAVRHFLLLSTGWRPKHKEILFKLASAQRTSFRSTEARRMTRRGPDPRLLSRSLSGDPPSPSRWRRRGRSRTTRSPRLRGRGASLRRIGPRRRHGQRITNHRAGIVAMVRPATGEEA